MKKNNEPVNAESADRESSAKNQKIITIILIVVILVLTSLLFYSNMKKRNAPSDLKDARIVPQEDASSQPAENAPDTASTAEELSNFDSTGVDSTVPVADAKEKKADLYVASYTFSEDPEKGEEFKVRIKIGNKGNASAGDFHWEWWSNSSGKSCEGKVYGLASGKTQTVECEYTYESWSTYQTKAVVDSENEISESSERNNIATKQVIPIHDEKPDLYVSSYSFNHDPEQGEEFTVSITIKNKGNGDADSFHWEWWPTPHGSACRDEIGDLDPGESKTVKCDYTYGGWANYATKAVADADNEVSESNEDNNVSSKNVIPIH